MLGNQHHVTILQLDFFPSPRLPHNLVANFPDYRELQTSQLLKYPQGRNLWATVNKPPHAADLWLTVNKPLALTTALMFLSSCRKGIFILERRIKAFQDKKITLCSVINCPDFLGHLEKDHNKVFQIQHGKCPCTWYLPASFRAAPSIYMLRMSISLLTVWYRDLKKKETLSSICRFSLGVVGFVCMSLLSLAWPEMIPSAWQKGRVAETWGHLEQSCCSLSSDAAVGQS